MSASATNCHGVDVSGNLSRATLLRGIGAVALINAVVARVLDLTSETSWYDAITMVSDRDMVAVLTVAAAFVLAGATRSARPGPAVGIADVMAVLVTALIILLPHKSAGWAALGVIGVYGALAWRSTPGPRAAAAILAVVSLYEVGGRLLVGLTTPVLTQVDAAVAAVALEMIGAQIARTGNLIETGNGYDLIIVKSCLSLRAILQALLVYFAFTRFVRPDDWRWSELTGCLLLSALVFLLNTGRLVLYGLDFTLYETLHAGALSGLFGLVVVALALFVAAVGVRHEFDLARLRG